MSLDIRLYMPTKEPGACSNGCGHECVADSELAVTEINITYNLTTMAAEAGIYEALWCPENLGITKAGALVPFLAEGLAKLQADPEYFKQFDAPNGWGGYTSFVGQVKDYIEACKKYPQARIGGER